MMAQSKVLIVDDDRLTLTIVADTLRGAGLAVETAQNGQEGLRRVSEFRPDLIVLDVVMPDLDGYEVARRLRKDPVSALIPIIMLTTKGGITDKVTAFQAGADDYLTKPFDPVELEVRVKAHLARTRAALGVQRAKPRGKVITLFSLRGGAGVTSLAVNLAAALAQLWQVEVPLVDLALESGHAALMLDLRPKYSLADLARKAPEDIEFGLLAGYLANHESGVRVLAAPKSAEDAGLVTPSLVDKVLSLLRDQFEYLVIDTPSAFTEVALATLDASDLIILVVTPEIAGVKVTVNTLDIFASLSYPRERLLAVVNHNLPKGGLATENIEASLRIPLMDGVPYDSGAFVQGINKGVPFVLSGTSSDVARVVARLAYQVSKPEMQQSKLQSPSPLLQSVRRTLK
jgi:pilus assembly protein CpaE